MASQKHIIREMFLQPPEIVVYSHALITLKANFSLLPRCSHKQDFISIENTFTISGIYQNRFAGNMM